GPARPAAPAGTAGPAGPAGPPPFPPTGPGGPGVPGAPQPAAPADPAAGPNGPGEPGPAQPAAPVGAEPPRPAGGPSGPVPDTSTPAHGHPVLPPQATGRRRAGAPQEEESAAQTEHPPSGRRRAAAPRTPETAEAPAPDSGAVPAPSGRRRAVAVDEAGTPQPAPEAPASPAQPQAAPQAAAQATGRRRRALAEEPGAAARPISVRTLGQGAPFAAATTAEATPPGGTPVGSGRRRKLANPAEDEREAQAQADRAQVQAQSQTPPHPLPQGRAFAIGAPDEGAEGPEPLDGPNSAVEVVDSVEAVRPPMDDELPPEPLDNPRRLLVWPAPDESTEKALTERGYRPVLVDSREQVDAQVAAYPAALFIDPLTGPITRTALQSLREAAVAAEVPVLVTAGLGQAAREAAYGADPAVLLKALAPRDSEMHPPRVLLIEEQEPIANALTATLERRGMHVVCAATDAEAVQLAVQTRPNLVVMDLMQVRRRRAGIVDWLRDNRLLNHTPLVVYTSADTEPAQLAALASGESVLFLAERSTSAEVQGRIVDLLAKIGTN
ncbi:hypothetical protein AB0K09_16775, partial [Streptomyces sp. NPDC049577]